MPGADAWELWQLETLLAGGLCRLNRGAEGKGVETDSGSHLSVQPSIPLTLLETWTQDLGGGGWGGWEGGPNLVSYFSYELRYVYIRQKYCTSPHPITLTFQTHEKILHGCMK